MMTPIRRRVHIASELGALVLAVPMLLWSSTQTPALAARLALRSLAIATVLIDGWLLSRWYAKNTNTSSSSSSKRSSRSRSFNLRTEVNP